MKIILFIFLVGIIGCNYPQPSFDEIIDAENSLKERERKHEAAWEYHRNEVLINNLEGQPLSKWFPNHDGKIFIIELEKCNVEQNISIFSDGIIVKNKDVLSLVEAQKKEVILIYQNVKKYLNLEGIVWREKRIF